MAAAAGCVAPMRTVEIEDYIILNDGREVLGKEEGLTAFFFENNPKKIPFQQYVADKYNVGNYNDVQYWVTVEGYRFKIMVYDNAEVEKYFHTQDFMVTKAVAEADIVGSTAKFLAISVINESNEDCLAAGSLYRNIVIKYLKNLKDEYNQS